VRLRAERFGQNTGDSSREMPGVTPWTGYEPEGRVFESLRAHQINQSLAAKPSGKTEYHAYESGWADRLAYAQKIRN